MLYQQTMKLRHAHNRLEACRKREAKASYAYGRAVRATEKAAQQYRQARRDFEAKAEPTIARALDAEKEEE